MNKIFLLLLLIANFSTSAQLNITPQQWQEDLTFLKETINNEYPFLFKKISAEEWNEKVEHLYNKMPTLSEHKIAAGMAEIVASFEYGHTVLSLDNSLGFHHLPINFYAFSDGVYIQGTSREYADLVGARVISIGKTSIADAIQKIRSVVPAENDQFHLAYGLNKLGTIELLHATDIISQLSAEIPITVEKNGQTIIKRVKGIKNLSVPTSFGFVQSDSAWISAREEGTTPQYLKNLERNFYYEHLHDHNTVYVRQSRVVDQTDLTLKDFYKEVFDYVNGNNVERLIIDVRLNGGGNNYKNKSLIIGIIENKQINQIGNLMVIIGRRTFSACQNLVNEMSNYTNAVFVGEPTAENVNFYGDNRPVQLPNSKLTAHLSFAWWQDKPQWENDPSLAPHLAVDMSFEAYKTNQDPILDAALNFDGEEFVLNPIDYITELFTSGQIDKLQTEAARMVQDPRYAFFDFESKFSDAGENLMQSKQIREAIFVYTMICQLYPISPNAHLLMGKAYQQIGDVNNAKSYYQKAIDLDPAGEKGITAKKMLQQME